MSVSWSKTLIDCDSGIVRHFEERNYALACAIGAFNLGACCPDVCPVVADASGPFGELCIVCDHFEDVGEIIYDSGEITRA